LKVLALETSGRSGSVALLDRSQVVFERGLAAGVRTAAGMAPLVHALLNEAGWSPQDVDLIAVTDGPGSFTGLRVGVTTAKVFAYAADAEVLPVNSLHVIAQGCVGTAGTDGFNGKLSVVMDAQRKQLFGAEFDCCDGATVVTSECQIVDGDAWIDGLDSQSRVAGPGLNMKMADGRTVMDHLGSLNKSEQALDSSHWNATAASVGQLALAEYAAGRRADFWKLAPQYFRLSYAEEAVKESK